MYLKKLAIFGFKSFADKTILHFDSGITCIVGPNGCGKSNIADAFRWVLGEQSAKSMRGSKMPDIIFGGTAHRKPLNFAEVSLTLTDLQGALPVDYEEITITRRLDRSGDSEYLLNGNSIRLKDLQTLFLGSGIGKNAFSIFEQGKLDQVIHDTPLERRAIFEEAAGILRFLQRKKEALQRLEKADLNLSRITDIHLEVEKQIRALEKQAQKARVFKEQKKALEELEKSSYVLKWQELKKKRAGVQQKQSHQQKDLEQCQSELFLKQKECQEIKQQKLQHEKDLRAQNEKLFTVRSQQEIQMRDSHSLQQHLRETEQKKRKLKQELEDLILAQNTRQKTLKELDNTRKQLEGQWGEAEAEWITRQDQIHAQEKEVIRLRQELSKKQQSHLQCLQKNSQSQTELKQLEVRLENFTEQQKQLCQRSEQLKNDLKQLEEGIQERKQHLQELSGLIASHKNRLVNYEEEIKRLAKKEEERRKEIEGVRRSLMEMKARQKVLLRMREEFEGFSSGSKKLLQETQNPKSPLYQKLRPFYEYFQPRTEAVEALAAMLRSYSQTLIVEHEEDFKQVIIFADQLGLQEYSLFCKSWINPSMRSDLSESSLYYQTQSNEISRHFLEEATIQDSCQSLQDRVRESWNRDGSFIDYRGVFFKVKPNENHVFIRESELRNLEDELVRKEELLGVGEQDLKQLQHQRAHLQLERGELDKALRRDEMKLVEVNFGLQRALSDQEKNKKDQEKFEKENIHLEQQLAQQKQIHDSLNEGSKKTQQELIQLQQEKEVMQQELERQEHLLKRQEQEKKEKENVYQRLTENRRQVLHQQSLLEVKEQEHEKNARRIQEELTEYEKRQTDLQKMEKEGKERLVTLEREVQVLTKECADREKKGVDLAQKHDEVDQQLVLQNNKLKRVEQELSQSQIQLAHQEAASQSLENELTERYHLMIEEAIQECVSLPRSIEEAEKRMKELRQFLQESGDINLAAIEDLEKHQERDVFLKQQMGDMQQSKEELLEIIRQLDGDSHQRFQETFELIRVNFKKNFQILFNGGEADLHFTDPKNILEAGIEITAKPPGKQMRSISLLSGGEKCLTAVALLFALFEVRPAPFCILDEIDAPLDDANVERFVNVVQHFVNRCQFLIITHNKRTMAIGDVLFGVSMEEKGVSKLLALEFGQEEEAPEAVLISS